MRAGPRSPLLDRLFGVDARALACFRISIGVIVLVDLLDRASDLEGHYSDAGVLPRGDLQHLFALSRWHWSVHLLSGSFEGQAVLFGLAAAAAVALAIGYRTRLATALTWFLLVSLQARNPMLLYGADQLLRLLLFWSMFLPLGTAWSVDRVRRGDSPRGPTRHLSVASAAILLQMLSMYLFAGLLKRNPVWQSGEALSYIFSFEMYARPWAESLLRHPELLRSLTRAVPWLEVILALLLFVPWATVRFRTLAILLLAGFHLILEALLVTGLFQVVSLTGLILFLPTAFWERLVGGEGIGGAEQPEPRYAAGWPAYAAAQFVVMMFFAYVVVWNVAGLRLEDYWARHRLGWAEEQWEQGEGRGLPMLPRDGIVERMLGSFGAIGRLASLHQRWDMFYRTGEFEGGWHVLAGTLRSGGEISLLEEGVPFLADTHPQWASKSALYPNVRWSVLLTYLGSPEMKAARARLAAVVGRDWNRRHPELAIDRLEILFVQGRQGTAPPRTRSMAVWLEGPVPSTPQRADLILGSGDEDRSFSALAR